MRHMNNMMNALFADPFNGGMLTQMDGPGALTMGHRHHQQQQQQQQLQHHHHMQQHNLAHRNPMMPFGFGGMPNIGSMLMGQMPDGSTSYSSSQIVSMTQGPDGRPQVYKATSSTKTGPGGLKETQKTVQDSRSGVKKMAIGHHIGERAHVIEREKNYNTGHEEERQDFINLEEEEADDFNREFTHRSRNMMSINNGNDGSHSGRHHGSVAAIMPAQHDRSSPPQAIMGIPNAVASSR